MANKNVPARRAGRGDGTKPGPSVKAPTMPPVGPANPASLSATDMQGGVKGKPNPGYC